VVECDLAKVEVAGSNPVSRSRFLYFQLARAPNTHQLGFGTLFARAGARYPSGKGEVCKTFMRRFDSDPRLQTFPRIKSTFIATFILCLRCRHRTLPCSSALHAVRHFLSLP
jgi:hypothetical protein